MSPGAEARAQMISGELVLLRSLVISHLISSVSEDPSKFAVRVKYSMDDDAVEVEYFDDYGIPVEGFSL